MMQRASEPTPEYNCIGFAYGCEDIWFDPHPPEEPYPWPNIKPYWPSDIPRNYSLSSFVALFKKKDFEVCELGILEEKYDKIAFLLDKKGEPIHATKQLENGYWASKLGDEEDVIHLMPDIVEYYRKMYEMEDMDIVYLKRMRN